MLRKARLLGIDRLASAVWSELSAMLAAVQPQRPTESGGIGDLRAGVGREICRHLRKSD
jgi:hypothetical protein